MDELTKFAPGLNVGPAPALTLTLTLTVALTLTLTQGGSTSRNSAYA